jgi:translocation and assembly module TamB
MADSPKRFTWRRAGLAFLLLVSLVFAGVYALLRSDWVTEQLRLRVITEVEQATGGVAELEALHFDPSAWTLELLNLRVRGPQQTDPFLVVPSASLGISIGSILSPSVRLDYLTLDRPLIQLNIAEDGSTNWPARIVGGPRLEITNIDLGRLEISQGRIDFNGQPYNLDVSAEDVALIATLDTNSCYALNGQLQNLRTQTATVSLDGAVSADLRLCANSFEVRAAELVAAALGTWKVSGTAAPLADPALNFEYSFEAQLEGISSGLPDPWRIAGSAIGSGRLTRAPGESAVYSGDVQAPDLRVQGPGGTISNNRLVAQFEGDFDALAVSNMILELPQAGRISGQAHVADLRGEPLLTADGTLAGVRVDQLLRTITPRFVWATEVTGSFEVTASESRGAILSAVAAFSDPGDAVRPGMAGNTDFTFSSVGQVLQLRSFEWSAEGIDLAATGTLSPDQSSDVSLRARAESQTEVERLLAIAGYSVEHYPVNLDGPVHVTANISSPGGLSQLTESRAQGEITTGALQIHDYGWDSLVAQMRFEGGRLTATRGTLADGSSSVQFAGHVDFTDGQPSDWPINLRVEAAGLPVPKLMAAADLTADVSGLLQTTAHFEGPLRNLAATADFRVSQGSVSGQSFDSLSGSATYESNRVRLAALELRLGEALVAGSGSFVPGEGTFDLHLAGSGLKVEDMPGLRERAATARGNLSFDVAAAGSLSPSNDPINFDQLQVDGSWQLQNLDFGEVKLGDWSGDAASKDGRIELKLGGAPLNGSVTGSASVDASSLEFDADVRFTDLSIAGLLSPEVDSPAGPTGIASGEAQFRGSLRALSEVQGEGLFSELRLEVAEIPGASEGYALYNPFPMRWAFSDASLRLDHMRLQGEGANLELTGTVGLAPSIPSGLRVDGDFNLTALRLFRPTIIASGRSRIGVRLTGSLSDPEIQGEWSVQEGEIQPEDGPVGLSGVNGRVMFVGREFRIEEMRAASGGGVLTLSGGGRIAADDYEFRIDGRAQNVRVRYPTGLTSVIDGDFVFSGGATQRLLSGDVVILRLTTARQTTLGTLLSAFRSGSRTTAQSAPSDSVQINVHVASASGVEINTSLIRNVAAAIDLRLVGTLGNPSLLGEINISQGQMVFHGSRYAINRGEIEFRNPIRIEPLLDFELETRMRGVDIALILAGPARRLNVSYRSDPPLSFSDLVNLVAVGRDPTTDPLSASRQRIEQQSLFQTGANNVLAQAVQSPVSPGLQRFFGVSRLKVDPAVGGAEANPAARISTEQQLTDDITLIYTYDLSSSQQQTARLEWTPSRRWTLVVTRDENGLVGSDAIYKTRRP